MRPIGLIGLIGPIGLIILCLTLVSCGGGGDDDLGAPQTAAVNNELVPITFNGSQGVEAAVTRASGTPLSEKAQHFHVWGYKNMSNSETQTVFPGYQVDWHDNSAATTTTNTNGWEYVGISDQTIKYWDWGAKAYRFFAVTGNPTYDANENAFTFEADASSKGAMDASPYFSRLWYSTGNPTDYPDKQFGKPVTLEFVKPYARVRFIYNYVYPREGITLSDQSFKPTDTEKKIYRKGNVKVTYPLSGEAIKESYSLEVTNLSDGAHLAAFTEDFDPENDTKVYTTCDKGWYPVLPNPTQGSYTLTVRINDVEKTAVVPAEYMKWLPGYSYTYIFKITDKGGIEIGGVEYAVTPWTVMEVNREVFNW